MTTGLQRLKPVHTAYGAICMPIRKLLMHWSWARDVNGRDRDETETSASRDRDDTEMLTVFLETRPRRDRDETLVRLETETSRPRPQPWLRRLNLDSLELRWRVDFTWCYLRPSLFEYRWFLYSTL